MASSTPASATELGGGLRPPSDASPQDGWRGHSNVANPGATRARGSSLWRDGARRLLRNRRPVAGGCAVVLLCLIAIFADFLAPLPYTKTNFARLNETPSRAYLLGTDQLGRDLLSRMIYGARVSMLVGLGAQIVVVMNGVSIRAPDGYRRG